MNATIRKRSFGVVSVIQWLGAIMLLSAVWPLVMAVQGFANGLGGSPLNVLWVALFVVGLLIIVAGQFVSQYECSDCGTRLRAKTVKLCPGCRARF